MRYAHSLLVFIGLFFFTSLLYAGDTNMKALYSLRNLQEHPGLYYELPEKIQNLGLFQIFPIPIPNAIGTNALHNAISSITFKGRELKFDIIRKDFLKYVSGGDLHFLEQFSNSIIAYGQSRRFVVFDIHTGKFRTYVISPELNQGISKVALFDAAHIEFLFEIREWDTDSPVSIANYILLLIDAQAELIDKDTQVIIPNEMHRVKSQYVLEKNVEDKHKFWLVHDKNVFIYYNNIISAMDRHFKPIEHPLIQTFSIIKDKVGDLQSITIHPTLPIAIVIDRNSKDTGDHQTWVITWKSESAHQAHLLYEKYSIDNVSFAPDGLWMTFSIGDTMYVSAIDTKLEQYIGPPIKLGSVKGIGKYAWIHEPQAIVVTTGNELYKWDISLEAVKAKHIYR